MGSYSLPILFSQLIPEPTELIGSNKQTVPGVGRKIWWAVDLGEVQGSAFEQNTLYTLSKLKFSKLKIASPWVTTELTVTKRVEICQHFMFPKCKCTKDISSSTEETGTF